MRAYPNNGGNRAFGSEGKTTLASEVSYRRLAGNVMQNISERLVWD
jgi:hypothetical protein